MLLKNDIDNLELKLIRFAFLALIINLSPTVAIASNLPVNILGLPLGGELDSPIYQCPSGKDVFCSQMGVATKKSAGNYSIFLSPDERPTWLSADDPISIKKNSDGIITKIFLKTNGPSVQSKVIAAVIEKFGQPMTRSKIKKSNSFGASIDVDRATWTDQSIYISHDCSTMTSCDLLIFTQEEWQNLTREYNERKKKDKL